MAFTGQDAVLSFLHVLFNFDDKCLMNLYNTEKEIFILVSQSIPFLLPINILQLKLLAFSKALKEKTL